MKSIWAILSLPFVWLGWLWTTARRVLRALQYGKLSDIPPQQPFPLGSLSSTESQYEVYKDTRSRLAEEIKLRRERQWTITTWVAGLFTAIIGGVIALMSQDKELTPTIQWGLTGWILLVAVCASVRILHDAMVAGFHSKACQQMDQHFGLHFDDSKHKINMRQHHLLMQFILILGIGTVLLVWQNGLIKSKPGNPPEPECCCQSCSSSTNTTVISQQSH